MEAILIMVILTSITIGFISMARDQQWAASLLDGPWGVVRGMIENGVWKKGDTKALHPQMINRHVSFDGDDVPN